MATRTEAELDQKEALADLEEEGLCAVLQWAGGEVDTVSGGLPEESAVNAPLKVLVLSYSVREREASSIKPGDVRVMLADRAIAGKFPPGRLSREVAPTGFFLYLCNPPLEGEEPAYPNPADAASYSRRYRVTLLENTVFEGSWPILHFLRVSA